MKTTTAKWIFGIVTIMFLFTTSAWADGRRGKGHGDHGSKYQQRYDKGHGHHDKYRGQQKRHHYKRHHYKHHRNHYRSDYRHFKRHHRHYAHRRPHRHQVKVDLGRIEPNPLFWLFPFPPLTPFTYR